MVAIARACNAPTAEFRADGRLSPAEVRLMSTPLFPDGQQVTARNLRSCQLGSTGSVMASATGARACAEIRPADPIATLPQRLPPARP